MKIVIKIKFFKKKLNKVMTKIEVVKKKLKVVMTKIKVFKKKIKQRHDKNQGSLEKKLGLGMTKLRFSRKN